MKDLFEDYEQKMEAQYPGWLQMTEAQRGDIYMEQCIPGWTKMNPTERAVAEKKLEEEMAAEGF